MAIGTVSLKLVVCARISSDRDGAEFLESRSASTEPLHSIETGIAIQPAMPPRIQAQASRRLAASVRRSKLPSRCAASIWQTSAASSPRAYATAAAASSLGSALRLPADYVPPTKPPSARPPEVRKSQLLRTYTSLLRSTPLILVFQHNNLTAMEWAAIRRELNLALSGVPAPAAGPDGQAPADITSSIQLQVVRTRMFNIALKVVEFFDPASVDTSSKTGGKKVYNHDLSAEALAAIKAAEATAPEDSAYSQLAPLLVGPVALLTFPAVSPQHLAAALSILSPNAPAFPAPSRKKNPGYYDLAVQNGLQKLLLVGGRIEDKVFDLDGVRWVGGIQGGLDGLRAQLVSMLQNAGLGLTTALEGASKSLWLTMESRRSVLEEEQKGPEEKKEQESS